MPHLKVMFRHSTERAEENHEESHSRYPVSRPRMKHGSYIVIVTCLVRKLDAYVEVSYNV
jgi:hypothetical protein